MVNCMTRALLWVIRSPRKFLFPGWRKNASPQHHQIWHTYPDIFCACCVQVLTLGHVRSGHQVTLKDLTSENNQRRTLATVFIQKV